MKAPSSSAASGQLMQQFLLSQAQSNAQQSQFQQQLADQQAADQALVNQQKTQQANAVSSAAKKPVTFGTILTSPSGLLGNPLLAQNKLS